MTNADRIRQMSDEELAMNFAYDPCPWDEDVFAKCKKFCHICEKCWLNWLKQEVSE